MNYTVRMNDVRMATGGRTGLAVDRGNSTMNFTTQMQNERIPAWWYSHVDNGERTEVTVDASVSVPVLGGSPSRCPSRRRSRPTSSGSSTPRRRVR
ncbi:hypothetical protein VB773_15395 [Haloarculaceae archaeon H-GB2-1]|nr:hypothetical protein [Haloarculaceae archaeon H-GB11]MEA5408812.1 hypothetical protein [Haloarculaceae archaeon H-GB2-1]